MVQVYNLYITFCLFINSLNSFKLPIYRKSFNLEPLTNKKTKVHLHLEKFNSYSNIFHIGISFTNNYKMVRYDFRPFVNNDSYITKYTNRCNISEIFSDNIETSNNNFLLESNFSNKNIYWGESNKSIEDIILFENTLHKKYKLGIYDCRHYVNKFTDWSLNKPTPIWKLNKLWY